MALTEIYVDPAIAANTGSGTIGDPYGDLQHALNTATRDATNGDRFNILAGTAEILAAALVLTTYGTPTMTAPLVIQGYTAAAGDGGIGQIDGNATYGMIAGQPGHVHWVDMKLFNAGANRVVDVGVGALFLNCEVTGNSGAGKHGINMSSGAVIRCKIHNLSSQYLGIGAASGDVLVEDCYIEGSFSGGGVSAAGNVHVRNSIFNISGGGYGVYISTSNLLSIENCSFYSSAGTGAAIYVNAAGSNPMQAIRNNIITGWSGAGGKGVRSLAAARILLYGANAFYNNTTNEENIGAINALTNITLTNAPFTNAAGGDFGIAPAAKAELQAQGWPTTFNGISTNQYLDPGAAQIQIPTATGGRRSHARYHGV